jgi:hypothetical protein
MSIALGIIPDFSHLSFLLQKLAVLDEDAYGELVKGY